MRERTYWPELCVVQLAGDNEVAVVDAEAEGIEAVYVIGDAAAPRMIVDSIFDGHRLAREIDSPHPEMPLPFIRERRLWGDSGNGDYRAQLLNTADVAVV